MRKMVCLWRHSTIPSEHQRNIINDCQLYNHYIHLSVSGYSLKRLHREIHLMSILIIVMYSFIFCSMIEKQYPLSSRENMSGGGWWSIFNMFTFVWMVRCCGWLLGCWYAFPKCSKSTWLLGFSGRLLHGWFYPVASEWFSVWLLGCSWQFLRYCCAVC